MFFSLELLSRRDSGFGLIWMAATLGAKSSFNKLPKRSVMTANISQLCTLIAEPREPLALRLSSNLMIGVARIYKVKQDILLTDVTTCFNTLKRAFQDAYMSSSTAAQLQMAQPSVRPDAVTLTANPTAAFAMDMDNLFADWDERARGDEEDEADDSGDDFGAKKKGKKKGRAKASSISQAEQPRADLHTLQEHNDFFTSSFDVSFGAGGFGAGLVPSSSQAGGYGFEDNFLEGLDIGADIGAELAKELGDGWGMPADLPASEDHANVDALDMELEPPVDMVADFQLGEDQAMVDDADRPIALGSSPGRKRRLSEVDDDILQPDGSIIVPLSPFGAADQAEGGKDLAVKRTKRVRLLLDARTELTNEELERARANYMDGQAALRQEQAQKKAEREGMKMLEEMIWGAPRGINAPALVQFWEENFKLQVEARSGQSVGHVQEPSRKRRRGGEVASEAAPAVADDWGRDILDDHNRMDVDLNLGAELDGANDRNQDDIDLDSRMRSSEEPGQARRGSSRPPSLLGSHFGLGVHIPESGSQRSNMFPWDNAGGVSSSISGVAFGAGGSDPLSVGRADTRLRRSSSLARGSFGVPESPASFIPSGSHFEPEAFEFAVPPEDESRVETQASDVSVMSLERNSSNFLEYLKMQINACPSGTTSLGFDDVVPKDTSTRHVAAAAFYHCLVLSTKDLVGVRQENPYGELRLTVK